MDDQGDTHFILLVQIGVIENHIDVVSGISPWPFI
jgi:hypothetical protein